MTPRKLWLEAIRLANARVAKMLIAGQKKRAASLRAQVGEGMP